MNSEHGTPPMQPQPLPEVPSEDRTMAMLCHLLGFFTWVIGPLIIWMMKKETPFVDDQGKEAINFQLFMLIFIIGFTIVGCLTAGLLWILFPILGIVELIFVIMACVESMSGKAYRYPVNIRLIK